VADFCRWIGCSISFFYRATAMPAIADSVGLERIFNQDYDAIVNWVE
jgi:hypothetical protein